jgi:hypothetical protein
LARILANKRRTLVRRPVNNSLKLRLLLRHRLIDSNDTYFSTILVC